MCRCPARPFGAGLSRQRTVRVTDAIEITSCQVSLKRKIGPVSAHTRMMDAAAAKVTGRPLMWAVPFVSRVNQLRDFVGCMEALLRA